MSLIPKKSAAFISTNQLQTIDHLAVVAIFMEIPLFFLNEQDFEVGRRYYPGLNCKLEMDQNITPESLIANYDVLFTSDLWKKASFEKQFKPLEKKYRKRLRRVFCPHGFSDKGFYFKCCAGEDICLIYGQNMLDMLEGYGVLDTIERYVITGNYRHLFYKKHQALFDRVIEKELLSQFDKVRPIILYAPTWQDAENNTTFFDSHLEVLEKLPNDYNMIVKLHPMLEMNDPAAYYGILGKYEKKKNVIFVRELPLIYPLLAKADFYLGDTSSVGYDFLTFNRPMFFLSKPTSAADPHGPPRHLFQCGVEIKPDEFSKLYSIVEKRLPQDQADFADRRSQIYQYTFGEEKSFEQLKAAIIEAY